MPHQITISAKACRSAYERFGTAFIQQFLDDVRNESQKRNPDEEIPEELKKMLRRSLQTMLKKVGKVEKKPKKILKNTSSKTEVGIRKRFKYKGEDQKGKNQSFLRINVDRTTREVTRVNEKNWTKRALKRYTKVFGKGQAWIIQQGNGKKSAIIKGKRSE